MSGDGRVDTTTGLGIGVDTSGTHATLIMQILGISSVSTSQHIVMRAGDGRVDTVITDGDPREKEKSFVKRLHQVESS